MFRRLLIRLILGNKSNFFDIMPLGSELYLVNIQPYESAAEMIGRLMMELEEQTLND